ncbi:MAG: hydroxyacid dehydrogenase [Clostridia bacterium]|nr:hydroxyacid dehydrogenase [Clostridia bacterium]
MKILITLPRGEVFDRHFPPHIIRRLEKLGSIVYNETGRQLTEEEMKEKLADVQIVLTHWGTKQITGEVLDHAPELKIMAHCAGTVAHIASEAFYERGIPVLSANSVMAEYVAESVLAYMLSALHCVPEANREMHEGRWNKPRGQVKPLLGAEIGLIGLGTVGRNLLRLLRPFRCRVYVYDPYLPEGALDEWEFAESCSFEQAMSRGIVSVHAAQTPETYHMISAKALSMIPDGGLFVNTSRGSLVDTEALIEEMKTGRISAALDVYEKEGPGGVPEALYGISRNLLLQPHAAALAVSWQMTDQIIDDLERFLRGENLRLQVPLSQYRLMTQE